MYDKKPIREKLYGNKKLNFDQFIFNVNFWKLIL